MRKIRVMWLLNHTGARKFELNMLKQAGIDEIYLPKIYPSDPNFRSASIDYSEDTNLTIPHDDLELFNSINWYEPSQDYAWKIASKYFDIVFYIAFNPLVLSDIERNFRGAIIWRAYGISHKYSYSQLVKNFPGFENVYGCIRRLGKRFWFAEAYEHLHEIEDTFISNRSIYLPLGMILSPKESNENWNGSIPKILFFCPDIEFNQVYNEIYKNFKKEFGDLPHSIGGVQSIVSKDPNVLGFLPSREHKENFRRYRVMYYHSQDKNHVHFHPFEAIESGMPLIFMGGGLLDKLGGYCLPGRSTSISDAKHKLKRILAGDDCFIDSVRKSQICLLDKMKTDYCFEYWKTGLNSIVEGLRIEDNDGASFASNSIKIAILTSKKSISKAIIFLNWLIRNKYGIDNKPDIVIGVCDIDFTDVQNYKQNYGIEELRVFHWVKLDRSASINALNFGRVFTSIKSDYYMVPDDKINYFYDCSHWVLINDDLPYEILPIKPIELFMDSNRFFRDNIKPRKGMTSHHNKFNSKTYKTSVNLYSCRCIYVEDKSSIDELVYVNGVPRKKIILLEDNFSNQHLLIRL